MWKNYDVDIENGCNLDFFDKYMFCELRLRILFFKNIFCVMCNVGNWIIDLMIECEKQIYLGGGDLVLFFVLLDVRGIYLKEKK